MNIVLTDLYSLPVDVQEIPVVDSGADSFAGMFHRQFPEEVDESGQVIELKGHFGKNSFQDDALPVTLDVPPPAPQLELSTPITSTASAAFSVSLEPVSTLSTKVPLGRGTGEQLPAGGNQLPPERVVATIGKGVLEKVVQTPMTIVKAEPGAESAVQGQQTAEILTRFPPVRPDGKSSQQVSPVIAPADVDSMIPKEKAMSSEPVPAATRAMPIETRAMPIETRWTESPGEVAATRNPVVVAELSPSRIEIAPGSTQQSPVVPVITGPEFRPAEVQQFASEILNNPRASAAEVTLPPAEAVTDRTVLYRDSGSSGEPAAVREIVANTENRASEIPLQTTANASQQLASAATGSAISTPVSAATGVNPASQQNPLPAQLESMSLTRNSDANEWSSGLSERVNWMINQKQHTATIRLDPPNLGKLDVQIKIVDDATLVTIQTQTAQTRDLIDSASTRLRDFLQDSGYQNVNVDVSQRQDQQQARSQGAFNAIPDQPEENSDQEQAGEHLQQSKNNYSTGEGLVDTFA